MPRWSFHVGYTVYDMHIYIHVHLNHLSGTVVFGFNVDKYEPPLMEHLGYTSPGSALCKQFWSTSLVDVGHFTHVANHLNQPNPTKQPDPTTRSSNQIQWTQPAQLSPTKRLTESTTKCHEPSKTSFFTQRPNWAPFWKTICKLANGGSLWVRDGQLMIKHGSLLISDNQMVIYDGYM